MPITEDPNVNLSESPKPNTFGRQPDAVEIPAMLSRPRLSCALSSPWSIVGMAFAATILVMLLPFGAPVVKIILAGIVALWWIMKQVAWR